MTFLDLNFLIMSYNITAIAVARKCICCWHIFTPGFIYIWFEHIFFRREGLGAAYNATMPSPEEVFTKEPNHTHTYAHTHFQE